MPKNLSFPNNFLTPFYSEETIKKSIEFLQKTFQKNNKQKAVIAVSGGIDSAVSLSLVTKALGAGNIFPVLLPFKDQDMSDARTIIEWNKISEENWLEINIQPMVASFAQEVNLNEVTDEKYTEGKQNFIRLGNIMARTRMVIVFDLAKKLNALVCGTENKSEKYLGYFTRFGDEAADVEPMVHLYKTQVRLIAETLKLPDVFLQKAPTAGLWINQTDEEELGFSYEVADAVMEQYIDQQKSVLEISLDSLEIEGDDQSGSRLNKINNQAMIQKVVQRIESMKFKQVVPYTLD